VPVLITSSYNAAAYGDGFAFGLSVPFPLGEPTAIPGSDFTRRWFFDLGTNYAFGESYQTVAAVDMSDVGASHTFLGVGRGKFRGSLYGDRKGFAFSGMSTGVAQVYLPVSEESPRVAGIYGSIGIFDGVWGGLILRGVLVPDLSVNGSNYNLSSLSIGWWWGDVGTGVHGVAGGVAMIAAMSSLASLYGF
jgi:hypothetical protein